MQFDFLSLMFILQTFYTSAIEIMMAADVFITYYLYYGNTTL